MATLAPVQVKMTKRQRLLSLRQQLRMDWETWRAHYQDLADFILPRRTRFLTSDRNRGDKRNQKIIDSTATMAVRTASSGMMGGNTSPARPWFRLAPPDPKLAQSQAVKAWLHEVESRMFALFDRSNLYDVLPAMYSDLFVFGTAAIMVLEDDQTGIRCYSLPIGSYVLACDTRGVVDTCVRETGMTVRQVVDRFGYDVCSPATQEAYNAGRYEQWVTIAHVIAPNPEKDLAKPLSKKHKAWTSCYIEMTAPDSGRDGGYLSESGFDEFPILAPRWSTLGEDVYGTSPAMDILGDVKALQEMHKQRAKAVAKIVNPPMVGPPELRAVKATLLPGDITFLNEREGTKGFRPAHEVNLRVSELDQSIGEHQQRIRRGLFEDAFLMFASDQRSTPPTAEEIRARQEEKLIVLGPVLQRLDNEAFDPLISLSFAIMLKTGKLPVAPPELQGVELKVEYISMMAQAQKLAFKAGIDAVIAMVERVAPITPDIVDKYDWDSIGEEYADILGVSPENVRPDDQVKQIRQGRAQQQAAQQKIAMAEQAASAAQKLGNAPLDSNNALARVMGQPGTPP